MYATGLRVSEVVNLKLEDLHLDVGIIQTMGKGRKERIVPIGDEAIVWINNYLNDARPELCKNKRSPFLFVNFHGEESPRTSRLILCGILLQPIFLKTAPI